MHVTISEAASGEDSNCLRPSPPFISEDHEKAALVGPNGAGKTTLLKMIVGEIQADGGNVVLTRGKTMGYLAQHQDMNNDHTIYQEVRTAKADILDMGQPADS